MSQPPTTITCIECGGTAHLTSYLPENGEETPDVPLAYRCEDCAERFDLVWSDDED